MSLKKVNECICVYVNKLNWIGYIFKGNIVDLNVWYLVFFFCKYVL